MKNLFLLITISTFFSCSANLEKSETKSNKPKNSIANPIEFNRYNLSFRDNASLYVRDSNSTELFYSVSQLKNPSKGILFLLPPTAQTVNEAILENKELVQLAVKSNILVVIPSINFNLYLDSLTLFTINQILKKSCDKFDIPKNKIIFGGFSLGGMNAIRYTEMAYENDSLTFVKPLAVYGIDPPLDFNRLYHSFKNTIDRNFSKPAVQEAQSYIKKIDHYFGSSSAKRKAAFTKHSMYSKTEPLGGNAQFLKNVPIRIYSDPDIEWNLKARQNDIYGMNALDQTAMINQLQLLGNKKAEYIIALGKGKRLDGRRHPHSWNIAEPKGLVDWMDELLK